MKTKFFLILLISILFSAVQNAQVSEQWNALYYWPYGTYGVRLNSIALDNNGNVYVAGYRHNSGSSYDYLTVKYNSSGVTQWAAVYNGPGNGSDIAVSVQLDNTGNVYVTGTSYGGSGSNLDYATLKYNSNGALLWIARYNGPGSYLDQAEKISVDAGGNVLVTGRSFNVLNSNEDYLTVKYNSAGALQWTARYNGTGNSTDWPLDLKTDYLGNTYVTGLSNGNGTYRDYATVKYNSSGSQLWVSRYNGPGNYDDVGKSIALDNSGNVFITGWSYGSGTYSDAATIKYNNLGSQLWAARYNAPGNPPTQAGYSVAVDGSGNVFVGGIDDGFLVLKYNSVGIQQWSARYSGIANYNEDFTKMVIDNYSNVYITGWSWGSANDVDIATVKYNSSGTQQWRIRKNVGTYDRVEGIAVDGFGNVYITGGFGNIGSNAMFTGYTIKYGSAVRGEILLTEIPDNYLLHQNYPNPFNPNTNIRFELPLESNAKIEIFNSIGELMETLIDEMLQPGIYDINWNASGLSSGVYFFKLTAGTFTDTKKMSLVK
jgi:uncharacterized delta-60 repeat protein